MTAILENLVLIAAVMSCICVIAAIVDLVDRCQMSETWSKVRERKRIAREQQKLDELEALIGRVEAGFDALEDGDFHEDEKSSEVFRNHCRRMFLR